MKQVSQSRSTDDGMQIDESEAQRSNAQNSIRLSREVDSKVTLVTDSQRRKQPTSRVSTLSGIVTSTLSPKNRLIDVQ
jgi:hypothetical protein